MLTNDCVADSQEKKELLNKERHLKKKPLKMSYKKTRGKNLKTFTQKTFLKIFQLLLLNLTKAIESIH